MSYIFIRFQQITFKLKAFFSNGGRIYLNLSVEWSILKEEPFRAEPPQIGHYREPPKPPPRLPRYKIQKFKNSPLTLDTLRYIFARA